MTPETMFRYWIRERELIRRRRFVQGRPAPWTRDPVLQEFRFTNVSRRFDRSTLVLAAYLEGVPDPGDQLVAVVAFRAFNRLTTWDALSDIASVHAWNEREALRRLRRLAATGIKLCSGVWMTAGVKGEPTYRSYLRAVTATRRILRDDSWRTSLEVAFDALTGLPMIGPFVGNEMVMDLAYLTHALDDAPDRETFVRLGPGSVRGLRRLRGGQALKGITQPRPTEDDWTEFERVTRSLRRRVPLSGLELSVHDVEHCLCEYDKYARALEGGHLKNRFRPKEA